MQNDINIDKILQRQQNGISYILHVIANSQTLSIQVQDKMKGDIWSGQFYPQQIQQISLKAKNPKKYAVFIKMLMSSLLGQTQSVLIEILTYAELQRKMNLSSGRRNINNNKKYIIMTYMSEFDKAHYPLSLNYLQSPSIERMRITIRRLAQQLNLNGQNSDMKEFNMIKYQNQTLKARIKNLESKVHFGDRQGQNMDKSNILQQKQTKKQVQSLKSIIISKDQQIEQFKKQIKQLNETNRSKQSSISSLKQQISKYKEIKIQNRQKQQTYALLEEKVNQMNNQTSQLVAELQHSRQKQKKSAFKIANLQKELQKIMAMQQKNRITAKPTNFLNSSRRSQSEKSVKSYTSKKSHQSNRSNLSKKKLQSKDMSKTKINMKNSVLQKNVIAPKRRSIYDSDTQSSKLRRATNTKVSPFRQSSSKVSIHSSGSKQRQTILNRFNGNQLNRSNRSRSKSREIKKQNSPAEIPTDNFGSSSEDQRNITQALTKLKERKQRVKYNDERPRYDQKNKYKDQKNNQNQKKKNNLDPLQQKITIIAEKLRKAKSRDRD